MAKDQKKYTQEFKQQLVDLYNTGNYLKQITRSAWFYFFSRSDTTFHARAWINLPRRRRKVLFYVPRAVGDVITNYSRNIIAQTTINLIIKETFNMSVVNWKYGKFYDKLSYFFIFCIYFITMLKLLMSFYAEISRYLDKVLCYF